MCRRSELTPLRLSNAHLEIEVDITAMKIRLRKRKLIKNYKVDGYLKAKDRLMQSFYGKLEPS